MYREYRNFIYGMQITHDFTQALSVLLVLNSDSFPKDISNLTAKWRIILYKDFFYICEMP